MSTITKRLYEGLFLVDSDEAASDWKGINKTIEKILARAGAEVVSFNKWDERRLAYDISGKSRGTYILAYFHCDTANVTAIERDVQLNEHIMRVLILRTDRMGAEDIERATPAMAVEAEAAAAEKRATEAVEAAKAKAAGEQARPAEDEAGEQSASVATEPEPQATEPEPQAAEETKQEEPSGEDESEK